MGATYNPLALASFTSPSGTFAWAGLLSDGQGVVTRKGVMSGLAAVQKRGTILKFDPATAIITVPAAAVDCNCILAEDVNIPGGEAIAYVSGKFKADALIWPAALGHGVVSDALRNYSILVESVEFVDGTIVKSAPTANEAEEAMQTIATNKMNQEDAARKAVADPNKVDPSARTDSAWAYLTAEEREKHPEWASPLPPAPPISPVLPGHIPGIPPASTLPIRPGEGEGERRHIAGEPDRPHQPSQPSHPSHPSHQPVPPVGSTGHTEHHPAGEPVKPAHQPAHTPEHHKESEKK